MVTHSQGMVGGLCPSPLSTVTWLLHLGLGERECFFMF